MSGRMLKRKPILILEITKEKIQGMPNCKYLRPKKASIAQKVKHINKGAYCK